MNDKAPELKTGPVDARDEYEIFFLRARRIVSDDLVLRAELEQIRKKARRSSEAMEEALDELRSSWMNKIAAKMQYIYDDEDISDELYDLEGVAIDGNIFRLYPTKKK